MRVQKREDEGRARDRKKDEKSKRGSKDNKRQMESVSM